MNTDPNPTYFNTAAAIPKPDAAVPSQVLCASTAPLVLLPVRLETRFFPAANGASELRIRVYPDKIHIDSHQPELTSDERTWGAAYWQQDWAAGDDINGRGDAWRTLANRYGAPRAAWIARALHPTNPRKAGAAPAFPTLATLPADRDVPWRTAPVARLLPDHWVAVAHAGGKAVLNATGKPITKALAVGPNPLAPPLDAKTEAAVKAGAALAIDPDMLWLIDFDEAERQGMAMRMTVPPDLLSSGLESLVVFGVSKASATDSAVQLANLLDAQSYTDGAEFLPFGTPTNNTEDQRSGFLGDDPDHQRSFQNEVMTDPATAANAAKLGKALGLPTDRIAPTLGHLGQAARDHDLDFQAMNTALWPVGWGYYLSNMIGAQTGLTTDAMRWARGHFISNVRAGGPLPAIRLGRQPYGVLPVTSLSLWAAGTDETGTGPRDAWLANLLGALREQVWRKVLGQVGRIGLRRGAPDPDADLNDVMMTDALSHGVAARRVLGGQYLRHLYAINAQDLTSALQQQDATAKALLSALAAGADPQTPPPIDPQKPAPNVAHGFYETNTLPITAPLVQMGEIGPDVALDPNYIQALLQPTPIATLLGQPHDSTLLEALLRHGLLREYAVATARLIAGTPDAGGRELATLLRDPELVDMVDQPRDNFILKPALVDLPWQRQLDRKGAAPSGATIRAYLDGLKDFTADPVASLGEFRGALDHLRTLDTETLQSLMLSTLDLSSHRLDAWVTSMATKRLLAMRSTTPVGQIVGGYGWVENLRPAPPATPVAAAALPKGETTPLVTPASDSGFIHAPSVTHAAAAALLRNAHLGPSGKPDAAAPFAIEMTSQRVREADRLLDGVRQGQPLSALLGYRFERNLHELALIQGKPELNRFIAPLRAAAPLTVRDRDDGADPKTVAANNVVDGQALAQLYAAKGDALFAGVTPAPTPAEREAVAREIRALADDIDGLGDALTAEVAYQLARGNNARLGATLQGVAQGAVPPPPELEVARTPRSGVSLTHRVAVLIDPAAAPVAGWAAPTTSPVSAAEPRLNAWTSRLLGDPRKIRCTVERLADDGRTVAATLAFPLSELNLTALDFVYGIDDAGAGTGGSQTHVEQLVLYNAQRRTGGFGAVPGLRLQHTRPTNLGVGETTLFDALEQGRAARRVLENARGLRPEDLAPPEKPGQGTIDLAGLQGRVKAGEDALIALQKRAGDRVKAGPATGKADDIRTDLLALGAFGMRPAAPAVAVGDTPEIRDQLLRQAAALLPLAATRLEKATTLRSLPAATDPRQRLGQLLDYAQAVMGAKALLLPQITCDGASATELAGALSASTQQQGGDPLAVHAWFLQSGQVREPLANLGRCLRGAEILGAGERLTLSVAQLPFVAAERWVGLKLAPGTEFPASKLSIAVQAAAMPNAKGPLFGLLIDEWVEVVPGATETTALTFQFDPPNSFAPQNILVAVPPKPGQDWTTDTLRQVLVETLDLAKLRAVDPALLGQAAQYLPGIYLPFNAAGATVSTDVAPLTL